MVKVLGGWAYGVFVLGRELLCDVCWLLVFLLLRGCVLWFGKLLAFLLFFFENCAIFAL